MGDCFSNSSVGSSQCSWTQRSNLQEVYSVKTVHFHKIHRKTSVPVYFLIKLQASVGNFIRLWHRCFPMNFTKHLRQPSLEHLPWLLLNPLEVNISLSFNVSKFSPACAEVVPLRFSKKGILKISLKFTEKHLCKSLF